MSLVVVAVIIALAVRLEVHAPTAPSRASSGRSTPTRPIPGTTNFVPRPDWFFYFLFYLLRIFKWPETVVLGTVGVPTILLDPPDRAAVLRPAPRAAAAAPPGRDRRGDPRRHLDGRAHLEGRDRQGVARLGDRRRWCRSGRRSRASPTTRRPSRAPTLFAESGCLNCHTYLGAGARTSARPTSPTRAPKGRGIAVAGRPPQEPEQQVTRLADAVFATLGDENLTQDRDLPRGLQGRRRSSASPPVRRPEAPLSGPDARLVRTLRDSDPASTLSADARLPRSHGRLGRALRGPAAAGARRRPAARSASAPRPPGSRCSRRSSTATPTLPRDEVLDAVRRRRRRPGHGLRDRRLHEPVRERLGEGRRLRRLPVLDVDGRHARGRRDGEPHPPRRVGRAQGAAQARARPARDAALVDPSARPRDAERGGRGDPLRGARLLPRRRDDRRPRRLRRRPCLDQLGVDNTLVPRWGRAR